MHTKDELVAAARALAARRGLLRVSVQDFTRELGISSRQIYAHFRSIAELNLAAGLAPQAGNARIPDAVIFRAMRDAFLAAGGIVTRSRLEEHLPFSRPLLWRRFPTWAQTLTAFHGWAAREAPDFPYMDDLLRAAEAWTERTAARRARQAVIKGAGNAGEADAGEARWPSLGPRAAIGGSGGPAGEVINTRGFLHAPVNEAGVLVLFGALAAELGFLVETVRAAFPDCEAKRRTGPGRWERVRIEFEYRSRAFRDHGHDPRGCEVIVCWEHDWPQCPLEVLELKTAVTRLAQRR